MPPFNKARTFRFGLVLSEEEAKMLRRLADYEGRTSAAAVCRKLIWEENARLVAKHGDLIKPLSSYEIPDSPGRPRNKRD